MDCVFHAYCDHLRWLGLAPLPSEWLLYRIFKTMSHGAGPQPTYGGTVPYIVKQLAARRNLPVFIQYRIWTPAHYEASAENWVQRHFIKVSDFGEEVKQVNLSPAIYLALNSHHAFFSDGFGFRWKNLVMAIQLFNYKRKGILK